MSHGIYLIDKPTGPTSHDVIDELRKITGEQRIGHAGTLDPQASGLMIVAVGRKYTRQISKYSKLDKEYEAEIFLGAESSTYDSEGELKNIATKKPPLDELRHVILKLVGRYEQVPPKYSAKKLKGKKAYELAREGKEFQLIPAAVTVHEAEILHYKYPIVKVNFRVSTGTYIRTLAHDLGKLLGTGAYLSALNRVSIGEFKLSEAVSLSNVLKEPRILLKGKIL